MGSSKNYFGGGAPITIDLSNVPQVSVLPIASTYAAGSVIFSSTDQKFYTQTAGAWVQLPASAAGNVPWTSGLTGVPAPLVAGPGAASGVATLDAAGALVQKATWASGLNGVPAALAAGPATPSGIATLDAVGALIQKTTYVATVAALQAVTPLAGVTVITAGRVTLGDGGGGAFVWDASNNATNVTNDPQHGIYVPPSTDTTGASGVWVRSYQDAIPLECWGGIPNDVAIDNEPIIRNAFKIHHHLKLGIGRWYIKNAVQVVDGKSLSGTAITWWQDAGSKPTGINETMLVYNGAGGATSAVVNASQVAVGTLPTYPAGNNYGVAIQDMVLDGNGLAAYGLYMARSGIASNFNHIIATGCLQAGIWGGELWTVKIQAVYALFNTGNGIRIGFDDFAWGQNVINACHFDTIQGYGNGNSLSPVFNASSNKSGDCGIALAVERGNTLTSLDAEQNVGAGIYLSPKSGPNKIAGYYVEGNAASYGAYGLIFDGSTGGGSVATAIEQGYFQTSQALWITGTAPSSDVPVVFDGMYGGAVLTADWGTYELRNVQVTTTRSIVGNYPLVNAVNSITPSPAVTSLYVSEGGSGTQSGRDSLNAIAGLAAAIALAKVLTTVTTIDIGAQALNTTQTIDGTGLSRRLTIDGKGTGTIQATGGGISLDIAGFKEQLAVINTVTDRIRARDSNVLLSAVTVYEPADGSVSPALENDNSVVSCTQTTIDAINGTGATKRGVIIKNGGKIIMYSASSITNASAGNSILMEAGEALLTDTTAAWTADINWVYHSGYIETPAAHITYTRTL